MVSGRVQGVGFRYRTLVGPIRVDLARRLPFGPPLQITNPGQPYPTDNSCFGLFGSSTPGYSRPALRAEAATRGH